MDDMDLMIAVAADAIEEASIGFHDAAAARVAAADALLDFEASKERKNAAVEMAIDEYFSELY